MVLAFIAAIVFCCSSSLRRSTATVVSATPALRQNETPSSPPTLAISRTTLDFTLVNISDLLITEVYVSPHDSKGWEENILGVDQLRAGKTLKIAFSKDEKHVMWDLRVVDNFGNNAEWKNLNLQEISRITLRHELDWLRVEADVE
jgi:hypothetical protein